MNELFGLLITARKFRKIYEHECVVLTNRYDLHKSDIDILWYIHMAGNDNTATTIASTGMSKANVSKSVDNLRKAGLIALDADPHDRRCMHIHLQKSAYPIIEELSVIRQSIYDAISEGISDEDKKVFCRINEQINRNISENYNITGGCHE